MNLYIVWLSFVQASQASATDLRLWSSYVQLLALLGSRQEAMKVAEKALSMAQVKPPFRVFIRKQYVFSCLHVCSFTRLI